MKKFLCAASFVAFFGVGLPAAADVRVDSILVNQSAPIPEGTNIRVNMINDGSWAERPSSITLEARENASSAWRSLRVWNWNHRLAPGHRLSLDYLPARGEAMDPALTQSSYELRAVVNGVSGQQTSLEHVHQVGTVNSSTR